MSRHGCPTCECEPEVIPEFAADVVVMVTDDNTAHAITDQPHAYFTYCGDGLIAEVVDHFSMTWAETKDPAKKPWPARSASHTPDSLSRRGVLRGASVRGGDWVRRLTQVWQGHAASGAAGLRRDAFGTHGEDERDDSTRIKHANGERPAVGRMDRPPEIGWEITRTELGWTDCGHNDWRPGVVLDPFCGSGTTLAVATGHGRDALGIDIDERNADLARARVGMFLEVVAPKEVESA